MNYVEFKISPEQLALTTKSTWECRNAGLLKIMTRAYENLQNQDAIKEEYTIRINTADGPSQDPPPRISNYLEFDTSTTKKDESTIFPDYIFGNWWHIGLTNYDDFVKEICDNNSFENIKSNKLFWIGNLQGVKQRIKFVELANQNKDKLYADTMSWTNGGRIPTKFIETKNYGQFRYLIDLSGQGCSGRLKLLPFCNRPLFITERMCWSWSDILILKQNLHVPVSDDLSDLIQKYDEVNNNQDFYFENSRKLMEYCLENLTFEKACEQATNLIHKAITQKKSFAKPPKKFDVVIAHYKENLSWVKKLNNPSIRKIFVYNKSEEKENFNSDKIVQKQINNVGRESHTYLYHCLENYDDPEMADFVFFLQGSPHGLDEKYIPKWIEEINKNDLDYTYNFRISSPYDFLVNGRCRHWQKDTEPAEYNVKEWCDLKIRSDLNFKDIPIFWNGCFGVSKDRILSVKKEQYKKMIDEELSSINPECGHYFERLWYYFFNMDLVETKTPEEYWAFWGGKNGNNHYGTIKLSSDFSIGLYNHPNESYWLLSQDKKTITFMNRNKVPTSILYKVDDKEYKGTYLADPKIIHRIVKL